MKVMLEATVAQVRVCEVSKRISSMTAANEESEQISGCRISDAANNDRVVWLTDQCTVQ